jgi:phenylalanyl-tRNA synthetase beta chain
MESAEHPSLHPGQCARILYRGQEAGWLGTLHPEVRARLGLKADAVGFEVSMDALSNGRVPAFVPLSRYPEVRRDLAFTVAQSVPVQSLLDTAAANAGEHLTATRLFDVYAGKGVAEGDKSIALGLTWQHPSRTLNDDEINQLVDSIVEQVQHGFNAVLRG